MKKVILGACSAVVASLFSAIPALADTMPAPSSDFGQSLTTMVQTGMMSGAALGQCISAMASGIGCICGCPCGI